MIMDDRLQLEFASANRPNALARIFRQRWRWLMLCLVIGTILGIAHYLMATPQYESYAELKVLSGGVPEAELISDAVLEAAIKSLPPKLRLDLKGHKRPTWTAVLRGNLTITRVKNTVTVRYASHGPETAARVLDAIIQSWILHRQETQLGSFGSVLASFQDESTALTRQMADLEARAAFAERWLSNHAGEVPQTSDHGNQVIQLQLMNSELQRLRTYHELFQRQIKGIETAREQASKIELSGKPHVPRTSSSPRLATTLVAWILLGCGAGLSVVFVLAARDDRFDSAAALSQLGLPLLGVIPRMGPTVGVGMDAIITHHNRDGIEAEGFRSLRTALSLCHRETSQLVFTSVHSGDGKTTTVVNLAVAEAQAGRKVLLVDADFRTAGLSRLFELDGPLGLAQVLQDVQPIADSFLENVFNLGVDGLDFMPAGACPTDPPGLLGSPRLAEILAWATPIYDQILIDAPVLAMADSLTLGRTVQGTVLVIRPEASHRREVTQAIDSYRRGGGKIVGVVASHVPINPGVRVEPPNLSPMRAIPVAASPRQHRRAA